MYFAAMDIGGTFIKHAVANEQGILLPETVGQSPIDSDGTKEQILEAITQVISRFHSYGLNISRAAVSVPGPFDYLMGIPHMVHKFAAIQNISLKDHFKSLKMDAVFLHDSTAFMLGEYFFGAARNARSPFGVMLGTGFGFAMMREGKVCVNKVQQPALILWNKPFLQGIVEDSISRNALRKSYQGFSKTEGFPDVKEIAEFARSGDDNALRVIQGLGENIGLLLQPYVQRLGCDRLVIGGQIARSADLFFPALKQQISIDVLPAEHIEDAALRGCASYALKGREALVKEYANGYFD